jgi:hypothetical protein
MEERIDFRIVRMTSAHFLWAVVFDQSKESKMHDSFPLQLFGPKSLSHVLQPRNEPRGESIILPWCLSIVTITMPRLSTQTRIGILESGFWLVGTYSMLGK